MKSCTQCKARFSGNPTRCPLDGAALVDLPDPLIGKCIGGRYRVESKIGSGGMASVYRASYDLLGRTVAIKFLAPELALDRLQKERFLREARATNRIKHENIVDITDYGEEEGGLVYLVMELLEGEPLANLISRGPIPPRDAIDYLTQTARALARAHELEVIHRDLKPENIFLLPRPGSWHVKLLDFGLAHVRTEARLTASGAVFGTPEYMSPEQARGATVGPASDLYALGVVFFEMLTGRLPFEGSTAELIVKHVRAAPPPPSLLVPSIPPELDAVVLKMLAKDPAQRHRDAYHLIDDLHAVLTLLPEAPARPVSVPPPPGPRTDPPPRATFADGELFEPRPASGVRGRADEHPTVVPASVHSWVERRAVFRTALQAAYPSGDAPAWVAEVVAQLEQLVDQAVRLDAEVQHIARTLADREATVSEVRERFGRALDELTRDESIVRRQLEDLDRRAERAHARAQQAQAEFQRGWREAQAAVPEGVLNSVEAATLLEAVARRVTAWRQAVQEIQEVGALAQMRRASREDLRFQVAQLKGRLGAMDAEVEHDLTALREKASELGVQIAATQEQLADAGARLAAHLSEFPAARPMIAQGIRGHQNATPAG